MIKTKELSIFLFVEGFILGISSAVLKNCKRTFLFARLLQSMTGLFGLDSFYNTRLDWENYLESFTGTMEIIVLCFEIGIINILK